MRCQSFVGGMAGKNFFPTLWVDREILSQHFRQRDDTFGGLVYKINWNVGVWSRRLLRCYGNVARTNSKCLNQGAGNEKTDILEVDLEDLLRSLVKEDEQAKDTTGLRYWDKYHTLRQVNNYNAYGDDKACLSPQLISKVTWCGSGW